MTDTVTLDMEQIMGQLLNAYNLQNPLCKDLGTPTNDVVQVMTEQNHYAVKLYTVTT